MPNRLMLQCPTARRPAGCHTPTMTWLHWLTALCVLLIGSPALSQADNPFANSRTSFGAETFLPVDQAFRLQVYSDPEHLWLHWHAEPGYYLYEERFGLVDEQGAPLDLALESHRSPVAKYDEFFGRDMHVYYDEALLSIPLEDVRELGTFGVTSQGCADAGLCYEPRTQLMRLEGDQPQLLTAPPLTTAPRPAPQPPLGWLSMLLFALAGGVVLNLMPCVFPVLSIKALQFTAQQQHTRRQHALAYCAGIVGVFVLFAAVLYGVRATGELAGWGFQLQSPLFIAYLAYLFLTLGLSLSGWLLLGGGLMNVGQGYLSQETLSQETRPQGAASSGGGVRRSFLTGVLASVVASPCTAPFMGVALGFAITQPAVLGVTVFIALGVGMALPLLLLAWWPGLAARMPAPGPWMDTFKQVLAFPLYLTVVWLLWVLGRQTSIDYLAFIGVGLVVLAFAFWLWERQRGSGRNLTRLAALTALVIALLIPLGGDRERAAPLDSSTTYSPERLDALLVERRSVLVNLTADWCLTCLANERAVLHTDRFQQLLAEHDVVYLKGDWTNGDPVITELLEEYDRTGVPLYLLFSAGEQRATVLPQLLRFGEIREKIEQIGAR